MSRQCSWGCDLAAGVRNPSCTVHGADTLTSNPILAAFDDLDRYCSGSNSATHALEVLQAEVERLTRGMNGQADVMVAREREFVAALLKIEELERANVGLATESERLTRERDECKRGWEQANDRIAELAKENRELTAVVSIEAARNCELATELEERSERSQLPSETTADCSTGTGGVTLAQMAENIKHGVDPYTGDQMDIEAIRFLAAGQDDPQSMALAACANEIDRLRAKSNSRPEGLIRSEVAAEIMDAIDELIKPGKLQGSGWDETAQRNGLILAYNTISQKFGEYRAPEASPLKAGEKS